MNPEQLPGLPEYEKSLEAELVGELIERDPNISETFYYFEKLTDLATGRTVGRKIGVVQEIVLRKYLEQSESLRRRLYLEQKLEGASGASHKVEFSWYAISPHHVTVGSEIGATGVSLSAADPLTQSVVLETPDGRKKTVKVGAAGFGGGSLRDYLSRRGLDLRLLAVSRGEADVDVVDRSRLLASLESKRVGAQRFKGSEKLGSGIQTIEKAKQASLVAIDLDLKVNGSVKPLQRSMLEKQLLSFVALGNGVHWTPKDKAVLGTYVDFTFLVPDKSIIRYAEYVRKLAPEGADVMKHFMDYFSGMTKQSLDDFQVFDDDFSIIVPEEETRTLRTVLEEHLDRVNPI